MTSVHFNWKRFWCPRTGSILCDNEGYLFDPESEYAEYYKSDVVPFEKLSEIKCLILLGEPGIGKTRAVEKEVTALKEKASEDKILYCHLGEFGTEESLSNTVFKDVEFEKWKNEAHNLHLFLDGLDECLINIRVVAKFLIRELQKCPKERLFLRIICRTADWPNSLEKSLIELFGEDFTSVYEMAQLRRKDVYEAARAKLDDADSFMKVVSERNVVPFAIKPVTLKMYLNIFKNDNALPSLQSKIYERGCKALCDESNEDRREDKTLRGTLCADARMIVAMRIAAATIFSNRYAVWTGPDNGDIPKEVITISELLGKEEVADLDIEIGREEVLETFNTGLFTSRGANRMGFAHHTYAEFLAALYLIRHKMSAKQISSLIVHPKDPEGRIVPQLYGVASWLAGLSADIFKILSKNDPEILLRSDLSSIEDEFKEELIELLLTLYEKTLLSEYDFDNPTLCHKRIEAQLKRIIFDKNKPQIIRNAGMVIARACKLKALLPELAELALDRREPIGIRVDAAYVILRCEDKDIRSKLKPLALGDAGDDPGDELKGIGLRVVWPEAMTAEELFSVLTIPQDESHIGIYHSFIERDIAKDIKIDDLPLALGWVETQLQNYPSFRRFSKLIGAIMLKAWNNLEHIGVINRFANVAFLHLKYHDDIVGKDAVPNFAEEIETHAEKRRNVLNEIIPIITKRDDCFLLSFTRTPILLGADLAWLRDKYLTESDSNKKTIIAQMMETVFYPLDSEHQRIIFDIYKTDPILESLFSSSFYVELNSPSAENMKKYYFRERKLEESRKARLLTPTPKEKIADLLSKFETGNIREWWTLKREMMLDENGARDGDVIESEMTELPGWKTSDESTKARILNSAKIYLQDSMPEPERWLYQDKYYYPDLAGYWALRLLLHCEPAYIETVKGNMWKKWASSVVAYPACTGPLARGDDHTDLLARTYKAAQSEFIEILNNLIDDENKKYEHVFIVDKVEGCIDERLAKALIEKIEINRLKPSCMNEILRILMKNGAAGAIECARKIVAIHDDMTEEEKARVVYAAVLLMFYSKDSGWDVVWPIVNSNDDIGNKILVSIAKIYNEERKKALLENLNENKIALLYSWYERKYPYRDDAVDQTFTQRDEIGIWRNTLLTNLVARGTENACIELQRISEEFPSNEWLNHHVLKARREYNTQSWMPPTPADIFKIAENKGNRLILSGEDLLNVIIESLERLECKLQGETPAVRFLWNENPMIKPKDESALSDYIKNHLEGEIKEIIVNREVEIRGPSAGQPGENTDIHVVAVIHRGDREPEKIKAIIEVKGCWHSDLLAAMETQLVNRYLYENQCHNGLYVVGWFACSQWDGRDRRKKQTRKISIEEAKEYFVSQAEALSKDELHVKSFVLNAALRIPRRKHGK